MAYKTHTRASVHARFIRDEYIPCVQGKCEPTLRQNTKHHTHGSKVFFSDNKHYLISPRCLLFPFFFNDAPDNFSLIGYMVRISHKRTKSYCRPTKKIQQLYLLSMSCSTFFFLNNCHVPLKKKYYHFS